MPSLSKPRTKLPRLPPVTFPQCESLAPAALVRILARFNGPANQGSHASCLRRRTLKSTGSKPSARRPSRSFAARSSLLDCGGPCITHSRLCTEPYTSYRTAPVPRLFMVRCHRCHICAGTGLAAATSAPGPESGWCGVVWCGVAALGDVARQGRRQGVPRPNHEQDQAARRRRQCGAR